MRSVHDVVTAEAVAERAAIPRSLASGVLASQVRAVALARSANHVVVLPEIVVSHRGDPLGDWCKAHLDEIFRDENLEKAKPLLEADTGLLLGTTLIRAAGCPEGLLHDDLNGLEREVYALDDIADIVVAANVPDGDDETEAEVERALDAFWDLASDALDEAGWVWPYEPADAEAVFEEWLADNLHALEPFGLHVKVAEPSPGRSGRQWTTADGSGRLDLLVEVIEDGSTVAGPDGAPVTLTFNTGDLMVVELKSRPLQGRDVAQIQRYRAAVEAEVANGSKVWGLLIGGGADASLYDALNREDDPPMYLWLSQVGFTTSRIQGRRT